MTIYKWIVGIAAAVVVAGVVWLGSPATGAATPVAQEADGAERLEQFRQRLEETRTRLNLTDQQVEQIRPILRSGFEAMLEVLQEHGVDLEDRAGGGNRLRLRQLRSLQRDLNGVHEQTLEALGAVLNDEQIETYKEIQEENREAMRERLRQRR